MHLIESISEALGPWVGGHPLTALGVTFVVAFLMGFLTKRSLSKKEH